MKCCKGAEPYTTGDFFDFLWDSALCYGQFMCGFWAKINRESGARVLINTFDTLVPSFEMEREVLVRWISIVCSPYLMALSSRISRIWRIPSLGSWWMKEPGMLA